MSAILNVLSGTKNDIRDKKTISVCDNIIYAHITTLRVEKGRFCWIEITLNKYFILKDFYTIFCSLFCFDGNANFLNFVNFFLCNMGKMSGHFEKKRSHWTNQIARNIIVTWKFILNGISRKFGLKPIFHFIISLGASEIYSP